jgi:hypothetical protein
MLHVAWIDYSLHVTVCILHGSLCSATSVDLAFVSPFLQYDWHRLFTGDEHRCTEEMNLGDELEG